MAFLTRSVLGVLGVSLSTYLVPGSSTNLFYQPRQIQFGVRATY